MTLEQQVTSLEISKRLKGLGVKQESLFWWHDWVGGNPAISENPNDSPNSPVYSAFTVAELGEMLWNTTKYYKGQVLLDGMEPDKYHTWYWVVDCPDPKTNHHTETANTEADARGKMLIYLLENKLI